MTTRRLVAVLLVAMAVTVAVARARRATAADAAAQTFGVVGVVTAPVADGRLMVAHEEIPGYMAAMTMPFRIGPDVPAGLKAGDRVRFTLTVTPTSAVASAFTITGYDARVAAALQAPEDAVAPRSSRLRRGDALPAFSLTTESGRPFTPADVRGHRTVVTFIFTRCPVPEFCPLMVQRFQQLQRLAMGERAFGDVRLLAVTLDPAFDTPPVLAAYASAMRANPARWQFVTGPAGEIGRLTSAFAVHVEKSGVLVDHTLATALIDRDGRVAEIWRGNGWTVGEVAEALRGARGRETE